ncbi:MAG: hypothetical protein EOS25_04980 [Mesorhizobium sp.]|nr:hypothetical protein [Mesorhizobium sp.]RWF21389.1 MAG: hypothetical protein EOS25_04980 [Mesorhizobium sp.]TIW49696.1 MAG: hypothetical protein E5V71_00960 [Mesorhizobium sp.]TIY03599.1 MAG: hypothetical protein E5V22_14290 [Mesorhizobium sp.]
MLALAIAFWQLSTATAQQYPVTCENGMDVMVLIGALSDRAYQEQRDGDVDDACFTVLQMIELQDSLIQAHKSCGWVSLAVQGETLLRQYKNMYKQFDCAE